MNLELFENVVKHCLEHFDISFKSFLNMHSFENWGIFSDIPQFELGNT